MMRNIDYQKLKSRIIDNVSEEFHPYIQIEQIVESFLRIIMHPSPDEDLNGIANQFINALARVLIDRTEYDVYIPIIANIEKPLRKLLSIITPEIYLNFKNNKDGLAQVIKLLGLNPNRINYSWPTLYDNQKSNYAEHLLRAYRYRNTVSHECKSFSDIKLFTILQSAIIIYLYAVELHFEEIQRILLNTSEYLKSVREGFKKWQKRFVAIEGKESIRQIALYAIETPMSSSKAENLLRKGEVTELREMLKNANEHQMIIVGEAGVGKTTTMQYISYKDSVSDHIPIYIELKLLTAHDRLVDIIKQKLAMSPTDFQQIMNSSKTSIFLDGLNEILPAIKDSIYREILGLIQTFPKTFFMISTRAQDYHGELGQIPIFALQKMDISKIHEFLDKNSESDNVRNLIKDAIHHNPNWLRILGTPLILYMLIQVVSIEGSLPNDENKIILRFIYNLYSREKTKDFAFNETWFHSIMCNIAFVSIDKVGDTNSGFTFLSIKKLLQNDITIEDHILLSVLEKGVELNLLVKDGHLFSFSHQTYQETLAGDYINSIYAQ